MSMNSKSFLSLTVAVLVHGAGIPSAEAVIKCWTNDEGVRECGDRVPPEYAQQGHQELSKQGMVIEEQKAVKTTEELEEAARQAALLEEVKRRQEAQARADRVLLATFSTVKDIEVVRDERLVAIEASIKLAQKRTETIHQDLDKRIQAAAAAERAGKTPNEALLKDIESLRRQIKNNNDYIDEKKTEQEATRQEYAANIERFKELRR
jgi:hypothetical protein